jgi:hypothetical protein
VGLNGAVELEWATVAGRGRLDIAGRLDGQGTFNNAGVVVESTGRGTTRAGTFRFNGPVSNAGVLDLRVWSAVFGGATTNTGTIRVGTELTGAGAVFRNEGILEHAGTNGVTLALNRFEQAGRLGLGGDLILGGESLFEAGGTNQIGGRMDIGSGRHVFRTAIPVSDWEVSNSQIQFDVDQVLGELVGISTTVTGAGRVSVSGRAELSWCTLRGDGLFHLEPQARLICPGTSLDVFRPVDLAGTTTLTNGAFWMISGVTVTNRGSMTTWRASHLRGGPAGSPGTFLNMGSLWLHGDTNPFNPQGWSVDTFENQGEFTVVDGAVHFERSMRLGGRTRIESGAALWNSGTLSQRPGSVVEGAGTWEFRGISARLTEPVTVGGEALEPGEKVVMFYQAASRDEAVFENPDVFDIRRPAREDVRNQHRAFGIGEHFCLGSHLARLELRIVFEELVRRIRNPRHDGEVRWLRSNFIHGIKEMPIAFDVAD